MQLRIQAIRWLPAVRLLAHKSTSKSAASGLPATEHIHSTCNQQETVPVAADVDSTSCMPACLTAQSCKHACVYACVLLTVKA